MSNSHVKIASSYIKLLIYSLAFRKISKISHIPMGLSVFVCICASVCVCVCLCCVCVCVCVCVRVVARAMKMR